jgi:hypothetical protein
VCLTLTACSRQLEPRSASDLVTLIADASTPICPATTVPHAFNDRLLPDGTRSAFTIPGGKVLVITSYDWEVEGSSQANNAIWTAVVLATGSTPNGSIAFFAGGTADSIGRAVGHTTVPAGVVVKPGTIMCHDVVGGVSSAAGRIHGFLADDR